MTRRAPANSTRSNAALAGVVRRPAESAHRLLWLQRTAGNQAVVAMVQRDGEDNKPLTSGQAALAVCFYQGKPDLYTPAIVSKIQAAVKSPVSGQPDADIAQGVGRFQESNVLKVDGMAGPRTLPRLFESGLATETDRKEIVAVGKAFAGAWQTLATPEARADKLFEGVKTQLDKEKVPTPDHNVDDLAKAAGNFFTRQWKMTFDRAALTGATADDDAVKDVAGTVYHESRHAEQNHKMARMRATKLSELGVSGSAASARIVAEMKVPSHVADDAVGNPLPHDIEFVTAAQQFDAVYGAGKAQHAERRPCRGRRQPDPAHRAKLARLTAAFKAYHNLPDEADAFATETDFVATWEEETAKAGN